MASEKHTYLVVWQEVVLALDLSLTIKDLAPLARVTVLPRIDEAIDMVKSSNRPIVAFIAVEPEAFEHSELAMELRRRSAKIFLIGDTAEETGATPQWDVFPLPFSTESIQKLLRAC